MANASIEQQFSKGSRSSLISLISFALALTKDARDQELLRYTANNKKPRERNRFQRFFYRLSCKLKRACSWTEQELTKTKGEGDDFTNR